MVKLSNFRKVIVEVKAAIQAGREIMAVENDRANECTSVIAPLLQ